MTNVSATSEVEIGARPEGGKQTAAAGFAAWIAEFDKASDVEFFTVWLRRQCTATGARAGVVMRVTTNGLLTAASWSEGQQSAPDFTRLADRAAIADHPVIAWARRSAGKSTLDLLIGYGIQLHGSRSAVIAVAIEVQGGVEKVDPKALAEQLYLGCGWLDARTSRSERTNALALSERAAVAMDIVALASAQRQTARSAAVVVNELAVRLRCDRVSLGLVRRRGIKLKALSRAASFQARSRVVDAIENAMEECLAQGAPIAYPTPATMKAQITVAHRDLATLGHSAASSASVVLLGPDAPIGALTFERHGEAPFDADTLMLAETVGALLGPVLRTQVANDRIVAGRVVDTMHDVVAMLLGRGRPSLKLAAIAAIAVVAALCVTNGDYRVTARAVLEGEVQRAAVAPFDGFISASSVRPGDHVRAGNLLAAMDDRDLVLDRARAWAEVEKLRQKYSDAMSKHDRPNTAILVAQIDQAEAQLSLADDKLRRSRIVSPIDGLLVSGDLSQMLGSPIERGKTLFEIAPLDQYRVVLRTDERDLRHVALGQHGQLALAGMPGDRRDFKVARITPITEAKDGRNEFRVEATLDQPPGPKLRPGMEGVGKIETGRHRLIWIWTHSLVDWLRLTSWKLLP